jgi:hypothetical protein
MSIELEKAIESLEGELQNIGLRVVEIKKTINQLLYLNGAGPRYTDIDSEGSGMKSTVESRQFLGKDMAASVKDIMRMRGKRPLAPQEIIIDLKKGDFPFPADWRAKHMNKNMAIFLGSNKEDFVWFDTKAGKVYALAEQYPERKKELEKLFKNKTNSQQAIDDVKEGKV